MDWQEAVGEKLVTPQEAVKEVKSGAQVMVAPFSCTPYTLCGALFQRRKELQSVRVDHPACLFPWLDDGGDAVFEVHDNFATPVDREAVNAGQIWYLPVGHWHAHEAPHGFLDQPDVFLVPISPPDRHGYCSFGPGVWQSAVAASRSKTVIAEVHENFIRTGGENGGGWRRSCGGSRVSIARWRLRRRSTAVSERLLRQP